jgi:hypothetical protein
MLKGVKGWQKEIDTKTDFKSDLYAVFTIAKFIWNYSNSSVVAHIPFQRYKGGKIDQHPNVIYSGF